jgi:CVNH domain
MMDIIVFSKRAICVSIAFFFIFLSSNLIANAQGTLPPGSYKNTCRGMQIGAGILSGQCQKADGSWKAAQLLYKDCEGDISNNNGVLTCRHKPKPAKPLPKGSYKQTCKDTSMEGKWLHAKCQKINGSWNNTSIKYADCNKDIWNNNGVLTCGGGTSSLPKGSYKQTCKDAYVDGNWLYAKCQKTNGSWYSTSIKYSSCNKDISNSNGTLTCGGGGGGGKLPKGSYKETCKNIYVDGNILEADCINRNGKYSHTSIRYSKCNKGVWNNKGQLECN